MAVEDAAAAVDRSSKKERERESVCVCVCEYPQRVSDGIWVMCLQHEREKEEKGKEEGIRRQ